MDNNEVKALPPVTSKTHFSVPRPVRTIILSAFGLLVLLLAAGVVYVKYTDSRSSPMPTATAQIPSQNSGVVKPLPTAKNAPEGVSLDVITSPVARGTQATVEINTDSGSTCTMGIMFKQNIVSPITGVAPQATNAYGSVAWTWTLSNQTPLGTWPVKVTCVYRGRSGVVEGNLTVTK